MKSRLIKLIVAGLLIILTITSVFTMNKYQDNMKRASQIINNKPPIEQTFRVIDKSVVVDALNKENKLVCLSGTTTVEAEFTNENVSNDDVAFKWIKDSLNKLNSKSVKVQAEVAFDFTYDLSNLPVTINNNTVTITISPNRLSLNKCQFIENKNIYNENIGLLSKRFSAQEINSINGRVKELARNKVLSMEDMRYKGLENVKSDIYALIKPLLPQNTNLVFSDYSFDVVAQSDVSIIK
jgi:hypothetical protein